MWYGYPTSEYVTKECQHMKETLLSRIYQSIIHNSKDMDSINVSIDKWVDKKACSLYAVDY